jgi:uncharacterized protein
MDTTERQSGGLLEQVPGKVVPDAIRSLEPRPRPERAVPVANKLTHASSPYLRQHRDNPVDWYEWGDEPFERARAEDKPVFLSVGYSSCHWCHVMAHESFEDDEVAKVLNAGFVSIKVDREERPDIDSVYMGAVQAMTGHGGWPMSVFLTPDGVPFYGGTYWPRDDRQGMPGFLRVLDAVADAWATKREDLLASGQRLAEHLRQSQALTPGSGELDVTVAERAAQLCVRAWDDRDGGFGRAPKFPQAMTIDFLLAHHVRTGDTGALEAACHSLEKMSQGGIYDHVAGGFARYSVDDVWLVPHFEKMLYDNALLLRVYTHAAQILGSGDQRALRFERVARETADYLLREMRHPSGGLYSATDADSEGIEGKFFVWSLAEFREVVETAGEDPDAWARFFGVTEGGNFADPHHPEFGSHTVLHEPAPRDETDEDFADRLGRVRAALYERRQQRVHPGLDDKVLTSWNALTLGALAEAGAAFAEPRYVEAARACAVFLRERLVVHGRLHHTWSEGHGPSVPAFLEDVAYLAQALLSLYEADHDPTWFAWARRLATTADAEFAATEHGDVAEPGAGPVASRSGFTGVYYATAHDAEELLTRPADLWDNATPGGASVMADVHLRIAALTGEPGPAERAERILATFGERMQQAPTGYGEMLRALERYAQGPQEVAVVGSVEEDATQRLLAVYRERWRPGSVLAVGLPSDAADHTPETGTTATPNTHPIPLLHDRSRVDGEPAAYVCRRFACARPVTAPDELRALLTG